MKKLLLLGALLCGYTYAMEVPLTETEKPFGDFDKYADLRDATPEPEAVITAEHPLKNKLTAFSAVSVLKKARIVRLNYPVTAVAFDPHACGSIAAGGVGTSLSVGNYVMQTNHDIVGHTNCIAYDPRRSGQLAVGGEKGLLNIFCFNANATKDKSVSNNDINISTGHDGGVMSVAYNPYHPDQLASGSADTTIIIWDFKTPKKLAQLEGHKGSVASIAYDPHNRGFCASGSGDKTIIIWDLKNLNAVKQLAQLKGHENNVLSVAYDPHNRDRLASGSVDATIIIWDLNKLQKLTQLKGHENDITSVAYDPHHAGQLASGSADKTIIIWDLSTSSLLTQLKGHEKHITSVAYDPHHVGQLISGSHDSTVMVWDINALQTIIDWFNKGCKLSAAAPSNDNNDSPPVSMSKIKLLLDEMNNALKNGGHIALDAEKIACIRSMPQEIRDAIKATDLVI